jgi:ABC-2 type transport system permease protein
VTGTNHLLLLMQLRWRLFLNSLRKKNRQAELGISVAGGFFVVIFWITTSIGFGAITFIQLQKQQSFIVDILLWVVFITWQLEAIVSSAAVNFQEIARYPISFRLYLFLNFSYGIFDPSAFLRMLWLFAIWVGVAAALPERRIAAAALFLLFALFNVLSYRVLSGLFQRFQTSRKGREIIAIMTLVMGVFFQLSIRTWSRLGRLHPPSAVTGFISSVDWISPPGLVTGALQEDGIQMARTAVLLIVYSLLAFALLWRQSLRTYQGEIYSESAAVHRRRKVQPGRAFVGGDEIFDAIVEKEFRYIRQNLRVVFQMLYVPVVAMIPIVNQGFRGEPGPHRMDFLHGMFAAFLVYGSTSLAYNIFGMDHTGFSRWLVSPVPLRKVMTGKNLTHGGIVAAIYLVVSVGMIAFSLITWLSFVTTTIAFAAFLLMILGAGNMISVYWPKRIDPTQPRSQVISKAAGYASLLTFLPIALYAGIGLVVVQVWEIEWFPLALSVATLLLALKLYSYWSQRAVNYLRDRLEEMASELSS